MKLKVHAAIWLVLIIAFCATSCNTDTTSNCSSAPEILEEERVEVNITRLENELLESKTAEKLQAFRAKYPAIAQSFLNESSYPSEKIMFEEVLRRFNNPHFDTLKLEVNRVFADVSDLEHSFSDIFSRLKKYDPTFKIPKVYTIASGFENDMVLTDSSIVIGLDFYLGKDAKYRPLDVPAYILERYSKEYIVPSCMLLYSISPKINNTNMKENAMLADMVTFGKAFYFAKEMMPCTPDSLLIWYNEEELAGIDKNKEAIWAHFLDNKLFYETNHLVKQKYIGERPKTYEISQDCPGRIGTWLGWQIVTQYVQKNEIDLRTLMDNSNSQEIFQKAKYRP